MGKVTRKDERMQRRGKKLDAYLTKWIALTMCCLSAPGWSFRFQSVFCQGLSHVHVCHLFKKNSSFLFVNNWKRQAAGCMDFRKKLFMFSLSHTQPRSRGLTWSFSRLSTRPLESCAKSQNPSIDTWYAYNSTLWSPKTRGIMISDFYFEKRTPKKRERSGLKMGIPLMKKRMRGGSSLAKMNAPMPPLLHYDGFSDQRRQKSKPHIAPKRGWGSTRSSFIGMPCGYALQEGK